MAAFVERERAARDEAGRRLVADALLALAALRRTLERRPDLLAHAELNPTDRSYLQTLGWAPKEPNELA